MRGGHDLALALLALTSVGLALPLFVTYLETGLVPRLPTAVLSTGLMLLAFLLYPPLSGSPPGKPNGWFEL